MRRQCATRNALDYEAYFKAATRNATISTVTEVEGDVNHARTLKKGELAAFAAGLAQDRAWLPHELRRPEPLPVDHPHATPVLTLAEAMASALEDDGAYDDETIEHVADCEIAGADELDPKPGIYTVADFLTHAYERADGAAVPASEFYEAYKGGLGTCAPEVDRVQTFSAAVTAFGIAKKRRTNGVHFLALRLIARARETA